MIPPLNEVLGASSGTAFKTMRSNRVRPYLRLMLSFFVAIGPYSLVGDPFRNLDFEQANTNSVAYDPGSGVTSGPIEDLLPGWTVVVSRGPFWVFPGYTNTTASLTFNSSFFDSVNVSVIDDDRFAIPRNGKYSLLIEPQFSNASVALIQRGDLPRDATQLRTEGVLGWSGGTLPPELTINGMTLTWTDGRADISPFAGQNVELRYEIIGGWQNRLDGIFLVPEPRSIVLWAIGLFAGVLGIIINRRTRQGLERSNQGTERMPGERSSCNADVRGPASLSSFVKPMPAAVPPSQRVHRILRASPSFIPPLFRFERQLPKDVALPPGDELLGGIWGNKLEAILTSRGAYSVPIRLGGLSHTVTSRMCRSLNNLIWLVRYELVRGVPI